ncbi:unnamed protein product [Rangifer tarandus platyrhynchus]|uniref:Uncharacterized protein n=1 Tax=Rangifer tarandus platyrhynchus TaxID=3082113 RepID=A0ABN8ZY93_RANTA|nr:unnamed protein product [Rangifer tarandus platyrhynchus]
MHAHTRARAHMHAQPPKHTQRAHTHTNTLAAGIHVPATPTHSRVELLTATRLCWEGVPAQLQSLRDPRRPGITPGGVKDPEGCGGRVAAGLPQGPAAHLQKLTQDPGPTAAPYLRAPSISSSKSVVSNPAQPL